MEHLGIKADFAIVRPGEKHCISGLQSLGSTVGNTFKQSWALQMALEGAGPDAEWGYLQGGDIQHH